MIRQTAANLLGQLLAWLCTDPVPLAGTSPLTCARCWRPCKGHPTGGKR